MSINKNSIFFKITVFFIILLFTTHAIIYVGYNITKQEQIDLLVNRYMKTLLSIRLKYQEKLKLIDGNKVLLETFYETLEKNKFNTILKEYTLALPEITYEELKQKAKLIAYEKKHKLIWELYDYKGYKYFYRASPIDFVFIKDNLNVTDKTIYFIFLTILLNITFLIFYIFLIKKLSPLNTLKTNIVKFSKGDLNINTTSKGKDEISEVSNEFNNAIKEIRQLTESRNLFLRNIMHELKTPITKGSLVNDMMAEGKHKQMLKKAFSRLQYLLKEFAKIEQLTSRNIELQKDKYRMIDIIDQAIDILMIDREELVFEIKDNLVVQVDFYLFSLCIKNLIDNGLKYGKSKVIIEIDKDFFAIKTEGEKLPKDITEYLKPFNREYESNKNSLGLGLYIVNSILKAHDLKLDYKYTNKINSFSTHFTKS